MITGITTAILTAAIGQASIWISPAEIMALPTDGAAWTAVLNDANGNWGVGDFNQNSNHDIYTLAGALAGVRLDDTALKQKALDGLLEIVGITFQTPDGWLAVGRNLGAYVVAADILRSDGVTDPAVDDWLLGFFTRQISRNAGEGVGGTRTMVPFGSGSNASAQEGFAYIALAAWAGDKARLDHTWGRFRLYAGAVPVESFASADAEAETASLAAVSVAINISKGVGSGWAHDDADPRPINPLGAVKDGHDIDGIIINDQRRGGNFRWPPGYTAYPWVGLEGFVPAAVILARAGYPAFDVADQAVGRAVEAMWRLGQEFGEDPTCTSKCWWDFNRATDVKHLNNWIYGADHPLQLPVGRSRTMGYTDWTHPGVRGDRPPPPEPPIQPPPTPPPTTQPPTLRYVTMRIDLLIEATTAAAEAFLRVVGRPVEETPDG